MTNGVITIFKILIGVIVVIIVSSLVIEFLNMILISSFLRGYVTKCIEKGCDLFAQETYIGEGISEVNLHLSAVNFPDDAEAGMGGKVAVSQNWYGSSSPSSSVLYKGLYSENVDYKNFLKLVTGNLPSDTVQKQGNIQVKAIKANIKAPWQNLNRIAAFYGISSNLNNGESLSTAKKIGQTYTKEYVTPLNQGITYIDRTSLENIVKWEIVSLLSNGHPTAIHAGVSYTGADKHEAHNATKDYVEYSGFRIYFNTFKVNSIQYDIYDLANKNSREEFSRITGIGLQNTKENNTYWKDLGFSNGSGMGTFSSTDTIAKERRYVCVANINYTMTVAYDGVTQLKSIVNFMNNRSVKGTKNVAPSFGEDLMVTTKTGEIKSVKDDIVDRTNNEEIQFNSNGNYQLAEFNSKVRYYIVR